MFNFRLVNILIIKYSTISIQGTFDLSCDGSHV